MILYALSVLYSPAVTSFFISVRHGVRTNLIPWCDSLVERLKLLDLQFGGSDYSSSTVLPYVFQTVKEFWLKRSLTIRLFWSSTTSELKKELVRLFNCLVELNFLSLIYSPTHRDLLHPCGVLVLWEPPWRSLWFHCGICWRKRNSYGMLLFYASLSHVNFDHIL